MSDWPVVLRTCENGSLRVDYSMASVEHRISFAITLSYKPAGSHHACRNGQLHVQQSDGESPGTLAPELCGNAQKIPIFGHEGLRLRIRALSADCVLTNVRSLISLHVFLLQ